MPFNTNVNQGMIKKCESCPCQNGDIKHLIFNCLFSQRLWKKLNSILNLDVSLKHVIVCFYLEKKIKNCIFKYNYITCRMKKKSCNTVLNFIKNSLSKEIYLMLNF